MTDMFAEILGYRWLWAFLGAALVFDCWWKLKHSSFSRLTRRFALAYFCYLIARILPVIVPVTLYRSEFYLVDWQPGWFFFVMVVSIFAVMMVVIAIVDRVPFLATLRDELEPCLKDASSVVKTNHPKKV